MNTYFSTLDKLIDDRTFSNRDNRKRMCVNKHSAFSLITTDVCDAPKIIESVGETQRPRSQLGINPGGTRKPIIREKAIDTSVSCPVFRRARISRWSKQDIRKGTTPIRLFTFFKITTVSK